MKTFLTKRLRIIIITIVVVIVAAAILLILTAQPVPGVISTTPSDGGTEIGESTQISINFNQYLKENSKTGISVSFDPNIDFDSTWLSSTYKIIPKANLQNNTKYTATVFFNGKKIYGFFFETATFSQEQISKYGALQSQNDFAFGQATKKVVEQNPWYTNLPIKTNNFVIYYDFEQQKFAISFLIPIQSADQEKALIQEAVNDIKSIGFKGTVNYYVNLTATPQP